MRDLAQSCELAATKLVEDLSGLLLGELVDLVSLVAREETQRSPRDVGMPPERLVCRDEAVAAERDGVPGDARRRVRAAWVELEKGPQVERAPRDEALVERFRARRVPRARAQESPIPRVERVDRVVEPIRRRRRSGAILARNRSELQLEELLRAERARKAEDVALDGVGSGPHRDLGRSAHAISADALEHQAALARPPRRGEGREAQVPIRANGEHVAEGRFEFDFDADVDRVGVRVEDADALAESVGEEPRPADRERVSGVPRGAKHGALGMHQLKCRDVVLLGVR